MSRSDRKLGETGRWCAVLGFALLVRGGVMAARFDHLQADPDSYRTLAENLLQTGALARERDGSLRPTAYRPPLYVLLLAGVGRDGQVAAAAVAALHVLLGVATVGLVFALARRWSGDNFAWLAAALVACDPILLNQSTLVMTETTAVLLSVAALYCLTTMRPDSPIGAGRAGGAIALAALCRPTFLVWLGMVGCALLLQRSSRRGRIVRFAVFTISAVLVLAPWAIRNQRQFGQPIVTTTHGGYTLLLGNNPFFYRHLRQSGWHAVWDASELQQEIVAASAREESDLESADAGLSEIEEDRRAYDLAWSSMRSEPWMFVESSLVRVWRLWSPLAHQISPDESARDRGLRYAVAGWYVVVYGLSVVGAIGLRRQLLRGPWLWGVLLCAALTLVHAFYWSNLRMRAPAMPFVCLLAAHGADRTWRRLWRRK